MNALQQATNLIKVNTLARELTRSIEEQYGFGFVTFAMREKAREVTGESFKRLLDLQSHLAKAAGAPSFRPSWESQALDKLDAYLESTFPRSNEKEA